MSEAFAAVLRAGRAEFNARFALARRARPALDADAFLDFLRARVAPVVDAVARTRPERASAAVFAAYDVALDLVGQRLAGRGAALATIDALWARVLPATPAAVAEAPGRVMAALSNAAHTLATTAGTRSDDWLARLETLAPRCPDVESLLRLGQVTAWRAGLAHLRGGSLAAAAALPDKLALDAVGAPAGASWAETSRRLAADPWFDPVAAAPARRLRVVARAGAFRPFGGLFPEPPRVAVAAEQLFVQSGDGWWLLCADAFGATFHRATAAEADGVTRGKNALAGVVLLGSEIRRGDDRLPVPVPGTVTSAAATSTTLALTGDATHAILLVALT